MLVRRVRFDHRWISSGFCFKVTPNFWSGLYSARTLLLRLHSLLSMHNSDHSHFMGLAGWLVGVSYCSSRYALWAPQLPTIEYQQHPPKRKTKKCAGIVQSIPRDKHRQSFVKLSVLCTETTLSDVHSVGWFYARDVSVKWGVFTRKKNVKFESY